MTVTAFPFLFLFVFSLWEFIAILFCFDRQEDTWYISCSCGLRRGRSEWLYALMSRGSNFLCRQIIRDSASWSQTKLMKTQNRIRIIVISVLKRLPVFHTDTSGLLIYFSGLPGQLQPYNPPAPDKTGFLSWVTRRENYVVGITFLTN